MAFKFVFFVATLAIASAIELQYNNGYNGGYVSGGYGGQSSGSYSNGGYDNGQYNNGGYGGLAQKYEQPAQYDFAYSVQDPHTGDFKSQQESRQGDVVKGRYSLVDSDGYERIVHYTADAHSGFNAVVQRVPTQVKVPVPVVAAPVAKIAYAAPAQVYNNGNQRGYGGSQSYFGNNQGGYGGNKAYYGGNQGGYGGYQQQYSQGYNSVSVNSPASSYKY